VTLRLLTYNIRHGGAGREAPLANVINACVPDVVLLQEATHPAVVEEIARRTGMQQWASFARQSLGFMSREPVAHVASYRPRFSQHAFIEVVLPGERTRIFGVHLSAVHASWTEQRRVMELKSLLRSVARHQTGFHILAGDFNTLAPSDRLDVGRLPMRLRPMVWLSGGRIRWRAIQTILDAGYVDAFRQQHALAPGHTMPSWDPHVRLDYVFVSRPYLDRIKACDVLTHPDVRAASDHLPLFAEIAAE